MNYIRADISVTFDTTSNGLAEELERKQSWSLQATKPWWNTTPETWSMTAWRFSLSMNVKRSWLVGWALYFFFGLNNCNRSLSVPPTTAVVASIVWSTCCGMPNDVGHLEINLPRERTTDGNLNPTIPPWSFSLGMWLTHGWTYWGVINGKYQGETKLRKPAQSSKITSPSAIK